MIIIAFKLDAEAPVQRIVTRTRAQANAIVEAHTLLRYRLWDKDGWYYSSFAAEDDRDLQSASVEGPANVRIYV